MYILAIAKSPRASSDRELVRWQSAVEQSYTQVSAVVARDGEALRVQIDLRSTPAAPGGDEEAALDSPVSGGSAGLSVQKYFRVNGVPRRASDLVGQVNAVMFSAEDLEIVKGSPTVRRRYLDILVSQSDPRYLRALQRYQRVVYQRNHLLRMVREGSSQVGELRFWDDELVNEGKYIMSQRLRTVARLSELAGPIHLELTGDGETLELAYRPSVPMGEDDSEDAMALVLREAIEGRRQRELAQGVTVSGPHRDDLQILIDGMDAAAYASRGQSRTAVLAMKLAEARYLADQRREEPILLLDDVLSELDSDRRAHVLDRASCYQQCFITTTDPEAIKERFLSRMSRFALHEGKARAMGGGGGA